MTLTIGSTSGRSNLTIAAGHGRFIRSRQVAPMCTSYIQKPKMVAMATAATSLRTSKSAMPSPDSLTPKTNPRIKQRVASYHTTEVIAHRKPKSGSMATSLSCRVSAISAFCRPTTQSPLHNQSPSRYRPHKASYSTFSPKIGCHGNVP